jgi:hypothetical protein
LDQVLEMPPPSLGGRLLPPAQQQHEAYWPEPPLSAAGSPAALSLWTYNKYLLELHQPLETYSELSARAAGPAPPAYYADGAVGTSDAGRSAPPTKIPSSQADLRCGRWRPMLCGPASGRCMVPFTMRNPGWHSAMRQDASTMLSSSAPAGVVMALCRTSDALLCRASVRRSRGPHGGDARVCSSLSVCPWAPQEASTEWRLPLLEVAPGYRGGGSAGGCAGPSSGPPPALPALPELPALPGTAVGLIRRDRWRLRTWPLPRSWCETDC